MSKKEARRAARQAFPGGPPQVRRRDQVRGTKPQAVSKKQASSRGGARSLRPPSLKRAAIQGAILAFLYFILIRFVWKEPGANWTTYIVVSLVGFFMFTGVAYAVDKFTYQRRLRKLKGPSR